MLREIAVLVGYTMLPVLTITSLFFLTNSNKKQPGQEEIEKEVINKKSPYIEGPLESPYTSKFRNMHFKKSYMIFPELCQGLVNLNKKLVLLGITGVGKTRLFSKCISRSCSSSASTTKVEIGARSLDSFIVDTPPFTIDDDVDMREKFIGQMQLFFSQNRYQIGGLVMVVNFERTDLMKNKITALYKYIRKFAEHKISIIITDWHLSEQKEQDEATLRQTFRIYKPAFIHFVSGDMTEADINEILDEIEGKQRKCHSSASHLSSSTTGEDENVQQNYLQRFRLGKLFNLSDTIFEMHEDDPEFMKKLNQLAIAVSQQK